MEAAIGSETWIGDLGPARPADAVVSTTPHRPPEPLPRRAYRQLGELLRSGGALVDGEHFAPEPAGPSEIRARIGRLHAERRRAFDHEDWDEWWSAVADDPAFAELVAERRRRAAAVPGTKDSNLPPSHHVRLLRAAGFGQAGSVWQFDSSHALVAVLLTAGPRTATRVA
ncbi:hypothetical protein [Streptomyces sp. NBC_00448]|uniref:hypothetical protein n=1 Tax=Streptomyces sp. NBC_00448 TaxID=2903652 RepID=UPI002E1BCC5D